jgi:hypothetical protein
VLRFVAVCLVALQTPSYPPAYPRPGATKLLENDRVIVWDISWLKQQYPIHRHVYDLAGVYYAPGDRMITSLEGTKRPVSTKAGDVAFQLKGVTHIEEGTSDAPLRAVFFEMKEDAASGRRDPAGGPGPFPGDGAKQLLDNARITAWEFAPGARRPHRHSRDAVMVWLEGDTAHAAFVPLGTVHAAEATGAAARAYVFELK